MRHPTRHRLQRQVESLRQEFLQDGQLPFTDVLTEDSLKGLLKEIKTAWNDRIFTPLVTLWAFLGQVLAPDQSCRAVGRLIAHRIARGLKPCSSETGGYCQARGRLPERFFAVIARLVGWRLEERVDPRWLWKGRRVHMFDGSTVSMPDTPENRAEYPLAYNQVPGTNFAPARIGAIISLASGAILDLGICRYAGKGQGEVSLLRRIWDVLRPGDVLLGDRLMGNWASIHWLQQRGVDTVSRLGAQRTADFRKGIRLGEDDHVVVWKKPTSIRAVGRRTYDELPDSIVVREVRFRVEQRGSRTRVIVVVTTILDPEQASREELASLYRERWNNEVCQADDIPRYGLYPSPRSSHSERGGAAPPGPLVPGTPSPHRRVLAMRSDDERPVPPRPQAA